MKFCPKCKTEKSTSDFYKSKQTKSGLMGWCKACHISASCLIAKTPRARMRSKNKYALLSPEEKRLLALKGREANKRYRMSPHGKKKTSERKKSDSAKARERQYLLKREYGLSVEEYNHMFTVQNGNCAICGCNQSELTRHLAVDHNHDTGLVRGLLCIPCNVGIGNLKDDVKRLQSAIDYLNKANAVDVDVMGGR